MDVDALRSFLAFVETGSFTRAAKQICRSQSAFSAQMRKLENEIGSSLFAKEGRNLILSEAGLRLNSHAKQMIAQHDEVLNQLQAYQDKRPLRLGCPEDYNDKVLPLVIAQLKLAQPTCSIHIYSEPSITLREWLDNGQLDGAILTRAPDREEGYSLTKDQGVWIASPQFERDSSTPLPLALFQSDCKYHSAAVDGLSKRNIPYQLLACCNTASAQRALVRQGLAIGAMGRLGIGTGLTIVEDLPTLPTVDIVLAVAAHTHPLLNEPFLHRLSQSFSLE